MNQKINFILIVLLSLLYCFSTFGVYAADRSPDTKNELVIFFKSTTFEIDDNSIDDIFIKLDQGKKYLIQGYACSSSEKTKEYLLAEAERRVKIVKKILIRKGFPSNNLITTAYDYSSECKVILKAIK